MNEGVVEKGGQNQDPTESEPANPAGQTRRSQADGLAERETIFQWDLSSDQVTAWTADSNEAARWKRYGWPVEVTGVRRGKPGSWTAIVPKRCIRFSRFQRRALSPEQLQARRESMARVNAAKKNEDIRVKTAADRKSEPGTSQS